ncbi:MAG: acyl-CoA dehydrogenase [Gammaproteobacteria bacterium SG8_11]|nr:MAG: acyl-CoA dehydrogenase [Gammaproteobacteria bacterium SG8_11]
MQTFLWISIFVALIWTLLYFRTPLLLSTGVMAAALFGWSEITTPSTFIAAPIWLIFVTAALALNIPPLRRLWLSKPVLTAFRQVMPSMSQTERDALEAGSVWWDGELFSGRPNWRELLDTPKPSLSVEEQAFVDGPVEELCRMLNDWKITHEHYDLPEEVWQFLKDKGFFGMIIPKKYGGLEFSAYGHSTVVVKVASRSITAAVTVMVPNSLGPAELLLRYGTEAQRDHYLPRLAKGQEIPCFALTSPEAGSDAASMVDSGVVCRGEFNGEKDVLGIRLNWEKRYITLGPVASVLGLAFKLYDPDHLIGDEEDVGITCALIPTNTPGVEIGNRHFPLNSAFQNGPNRGKDVFIPIDWIIGGATQAGNGWRMLMECLAAGRSISLPALSVGAGKLAARATGAYSRVRQQFKTPIGRFEGVEEKLAHIAAGTYMMDAVRTLTTSAIDMGQSPSVISAIVKYNLTEGMRILINHAMDIQGGSGISMGPRNMLARVYQTIPISITVEGANILTRSMIIFGQGAIRCHPYVLKEILAAQQTDQNKALRDFDTALIGHMGFTLSNMARTLFLGLTKARWVRPPVSGPGRYYYQQLTRMSSALAFVSDVAMLVLGGSLKRREKLSGRLADVLSQLYLTSAALKRFEDDKQPFEDVPLLQWSCENALRIMQQSLDKFIINFPNRPMAWLLRRIVFPLGKTYSGPTDLSGHKAADLILHPSTARDRLTAGVYLPDAEQYRLTEPMSRLEYALHCVIAAEAAEKTLRKALREGKLSAPNREQQIRQAVDLNIFNSEEAHLLATADAARREAIMVDDFEPQTLAPRNSVQANASNSSPSAKECA